MNATRAAAKQKAEALGATWHEGFGGWYEFNVEAPAGHVWASDQSIHELVNATSGDDSIPAPNSLFWRHVLHRMADGVVPCDMADCDWCSGTA
jgi:hypothetical protein